MLNSAVDVTGVSGVGVSVLVAAVDGWPLVDVGVDVATFAFPFPVTVEVPLTWPALDHFGAGPNVGLYTSGSGSWNSFLSFKFCTAFLATSTIWSSRGLSMTRRFLGVTASV